MKSVNPIPPPGLGLRAPVDLSAEEFCRQIGGECDEYADKFESLDELLLCDGIKMKNKEIPVHQRRYMLRCIELLRRGLLTFEYLGRRTQLDRVKGR